MSFVVPKFSKAEVNRAGLVLAEKAQSNDPFDQRWQRANAVLANWRGAHAYPINTFQATLRARLKSIDSEALVAQRLKRAPSIIAKLQRFEGMQLSRMQDIGGLRAVLRSKVELSQLRTLYEGAYSTHELLSVRDYLNAPKSDGYRSIHQVLPLPKPAGSVL